MMPPNIKAQLDLISGFFTDPACAYQRAKWLLSDFKESVWKYQLATKTVQAIDWKILLEDGSLLTAPQNASLLSSLQHYLVASTRNASDMLSETNSSGAQRYDFDRAGHIIDHLLLNSEHYELAKFGLEALNENSFKGILKRVCDFRDIDGFFEWEASVGRLALNLMEAIPEDEINRTLNSLPGISTVTPEQEDENNLEIPTKDLPRARAALYIHGFIAKTKSGYQPDNLSLGERLYKNTLFAKSRRRSKIKALCFAEKAEYIRREYPAIRWSTCSLEHTPHERLAAYQRSIYRLGVLHEIGLAAPRISDLQSAIAYEPELSRSGRHRSLPSLVALGAIKNAIEFHLEHGTHLVDSFCLLALHSIRKGKSPAWFKGKNLSKILHKKTSAMGVTQVTLTTTAYKSGKEKYFSQLRTNAGLIDLLRVYAGSVQIVVGALAARRIGELVDLDALSCLDSTEKWLVFLNRKSTKGLYGIRYFKSRPIEPIAAQMIKNLIRMQMILKRIGYIKTTSNIFAMPCSKGTKNFTKCTDETFNKNLDIFCDYFETKINPNGERYYIRQHQLRRFFAMLFFHTSSFGGLETLQWMLAHIDKSHVWQYITESMDGAALMGAKAQCVAEQMFHGDSTSYEDLAKLLKTRYGTEDFLISDADELEDEITQLQKEGRVTIEPEFFYNEHGEQMRIIVKIIGDADE